MDKRTYFVILVSIFLLSTILIRVPGKKKTENIVIPKENVSVKDIALDIIRNYPEVVLFDEKYKINEVKEINVAGYDFYYVNYSIGNRNSAVIISKDGKYVGFYAENNGIYQMVLYPIEKLKNMLKLSLPKKSRRPKVYLFLMSFCPYGNQMEKIFDEILEKIGDYIDFEPVYIYYLAKGGQRECKKVGNNCYWSLHGMNELEEDLVEKAVFKIYGAKTWSKFVKKVDEKCNLNNVLDCWKDVAKELNLDIEKIENYVKENWTKMIEEDYLTSVRYNAFASPTLIVNDVEYRYARRTKYILAFICKAFEKPPKECYS